MEKIECFMAEQWVVKALDEGLAPDEWLRLEEHLHECPACSRMREATQEVLDLVAGDVPADPGEEFWTRYHQSLAARLREKELQASSWFGWRVAVAAALVGVVVLSVALGVLDWRTDEAFQSRQVAMRVADDLADLYGPVQEETPSYGLAADQTLTLVTSQAPYNGGMANWFEDEDEPDQLLM